MITLAVFDLDGTLVNSLDDITDSMNDTLRQKDYPIHTEEEIRYMVGRGSRYLCTKALPPQASQEEVEALLAEYNRRYLQNCCRKTRPYPGILDLLKRLHNDGIDCAVLSNKPHSQTCEVVSRLLGDSWFVGVQGAKEGVSHKPAPEGLWNLLQSLKKEKEEALYIGDSQVDIQLGRNAGVLAIGVAWGFRGIDELVREQAPYIAQTPQDIADFLQRKNRG